MEMVKMAVIGLVDVEAKRKEIGATGAMTVDNVPALLRRCLLSVQRMSWTLPESV
jgi:hypothetical protein